MKHSPIRTAQEFEALMLSIDAKLQQEKVPIPWRGLKAQQEVSRRLEVEIPFNGPFDFTPKPGDYTWSSLSGHISKWLEDRYGDRMKLDFSLGYTAIAIRNDAWLMKIPLVLGRVQAVCDRNLAEDSPTMKVYKPGEDATPLQMNVLRLLHQFPQGLANQLTTAELKFVLHVFMESLACFRYFDGTYRKENLVVMAMSDLTSSARRAAGTPEEYGMSRWDSLQAAEKLLKFFLTQRGQSFPKSHNLADLFTLAASAGLPMPPKSFIDSIQCDAGVRYEVRPYTSTEVVHAHRAAVLVGYEVAAALGGVA
ncbi:MAG: hypothetical protein AMXMBFR59_12820 [Rhodanobacteraceae bacterium]